MIALSEHFAQFIILVLSFSNKNNKNTLESFRLRLETCSPWRSSRWHLELAGPSDSRNMGQMVHNYKKVDHYKRIKVKVRLGIRVRG